MSTDPPSDRRRSAYRGVIVRDRKSCFVAKTKYRGQSVWIGSWDTEESAAFAYDVAVRYLQGPEAITNFPFKQAPLTIRAQVAQSLARLGIIEE